MSFKIRFATDVNLLAAKCVSCGKWDGRAMQHWSAEVKRFCSVLPRVGTHTQRYHQSGVCGVVSGEECEFICALKT